MSRNCLSFRSTWVRQQLISRFVVSQSYFFVYCFVYHYFSFFVFWQTLYCIAEILLMLALSTKQPLYCLSFELRLLITPLVSSNFSDQNNRLSASCFLEQRSLCFHVTLETCHEDNLTGCIYMEVENASQKMGNISFFPFQILLCDLTSTFDRKI